MSISNRQKVNRHALASVLFGGLILHACVVFAIPPPSPPQDSPSKITVNVNSVLVPVVVLDANGHPVRDLTKEDFKILVKDQPQTITSFAIEQHTATQSSGKEVALNPNVAAPPVSPLRRPERFLIYLFDDLHLNVADLPRVQIAASKLLAETLSPTDMAAVMSIAGTNSGLTRDSATLQGTVKKVRVQNLYHHDESSCPNISYYQADLIVNKRNQQALESGMANYVTCAHLVGAIPAMLEAAVQSASAQTLALGDADAQVSMSMIKKLIQVMGNLPGQRRLVLISPGFPAYSQQAMAARSEILDLAARLDVTVSALDVRGLYTTEMNASQRGGYSAHDLATGVHSEYERTAMNLNEDIMAELANGTGGTFFHNSNDLENGLKSLTQVPDYLYLLEFSPDMQKPDGKFHSLHVVVDKQNVKIQTRKGYFESRPQISGPH